MKKKFLTTVDFKVTRMVAIEANDEEDAMKKLESAIREGKIEVSNKYVSSHNVNGMTDVTDDHTRLFDITSCKI